MSTLEIRQIDFLPDKFRHAVRRRRASYWRVVVVFMFMGVFVAAAWGLQAARRVVRLEYDQTAARYTAAQAQETLLKNREARLAELRAYADLVTFLRHPWPRSQLVEQLFAPLPDTVVLVKLHLGTQPRPVVVAAGEAPGEAGGEATVARTASTDLVELRKSVEANDLVIHLEGTTADQPQLHLYLHRLAGSTLFHRAEVEAIESAVGEGDTAGVTSSSASRFTARIVVRTGWGLTEGPLLDEVSVAAETTSIGGKP